MDNPNNQLFFAGLEAGLEQTIGSVLQLSRRYRLTVEVGNIANDVNAPFLFGGFPGYRVELRAGGVVLAADANTLLPPKGPSCRRSSRWTSEPHMHRRGCRCASAS